jgi:hypothetical protein
MFFPQHTRRRTLALELVERHGRDPGVCGKWAATAGNGCKAVVAKSTPTSFRAGLGEGAIVHIHRRPATMIFFIDCLAALCVMQTNGAMHAQGGRGGLFLAFLPANLGPATRSGTLHGVRKSGDRGAGFVEGWAELRRNECGYDTALCHLRRMHWRVEGGDGIRGAAVRL